MLKAGPIDLYNGPMPVHVFGEKLNRQHEDDFYKCIKNTGDVADTFYNSNFRKVFKNGSTQSESINEIFSSLMQIQQDLLSEK